MGDENKRQKMLVELKREGGVWFIVYTFENNLVYGNIRKYTT